MSPNDKGGNRHALMGIGHARIAQGPDALTAGCQSSPASDLKQSAQPIACRPACPPLAACPPIGWLLAASLLGSPLSRANPFTCRPQKHTKSITHIMSFGCFQAQTHMNERVFPVAPNSAVAAVFVHHNGMWSALDYARDVRPIRKINSLEETAHCNSATAEHLGGRMVLAEIKPHGGHPESNADETNKGRAAIFLNSMLAGSGALKWRLTWSCFGASRNTTSTTTTTATTTATTTTTTPIPRRLRPQRRR